MSTDPSALDEAIHAALTDRYQKVAMVGAKVADRLGGSWTDDCRAAVLRLREMVALGVVIDGVGDLDEPRCSEVRRRAASPD